MLSTATAAAMPISAEKILTECKGPGKRPIKCVRYSKDHLYFNKKKKQIICPNKDVPGIKGKADAWYKLFKWLQEEHNRKHKPSQQDTRALVSSLSPENKRTLLSPLQSSNTSSGILQTFIA
eukprot:10521995-Ditylum_brightwellii.AAC.1